MARRFNWNRNHEETLRTLRRRHENTFEAGKKLRRNVNGRHRNLSERQYVILRFRGTYGVTSADVSDQAIWAKYQRVNGMLGAGARRAAARVNVQVAAKFVADNGMVFTRGMRMRDWEDLGLTFLGSGVSRKVYDLGNAVLKVSRGSNGRFDGDQSNRREVRTWKSVAGSADEPMFAAILAADPENGWIIQEKVDTSQPLPQGAFGRLEAAARRHNVSDLHFGNVGLRGNQPVILDYASA